jgi:hypothetical protein
MSCLKTDINGVFQCFELFYLQLKDGVDSEIATAAKEAKRAARASKSSASTAAKLTASSAKYSRFDAEVNESSLVNKQFSYALCKCTSLQLIHCSLEPAYKQASLGRTCACRVFVLLLPYP